MIRIPWTIDLSGHEEDQPQDVYRSRASRRGEGGVVTNSASLQSLGDSEEEGIHEKAVPNDRERYLNAKGSSENVLKQRAPCRNGSILADTTRFSRQKLEEKARHIHAKSNRVRSSPGQSILEFDGSSNAERAVSWRKVLFDHSASFEKSIQANM